MPKTKVMNKVPDRMLQKLLQDEKAYLPVAITTSPKRSIMQQQHAANINLAELQSMLVAESNNEFF